MGGGFTLEVKRLLTAAGCIYERPGKGDHEIWYSPVTKRRFPVDHKILSRHTSLAGGPRISRAAFLEHRCV